MLSQLRKLATYSRVRPRSFLLIVTLLHFSKKISLIKHLLPHEMIIKNSIGQFCIEPHNDSVYLCQPYFEKGLHEWIVDGKGKLFLDIGANVGLYTVLSLLHCRYTRVFAFEPNPHTYKLLCRNIALNGLLDRTELFNVAAGQKEDVLPFNCCQKLAGLSRFACCEKPNDNYEVINVKTRPVDSILKENGIDACEIGFIKIDVEGFEEQVLNGLRDTLRASDCTKLLVEIHKPGRDRIAVLLKDMGYIQKKRLGSNHLFVKEAFYQFA